MRATRHLAALASFLLLPGLAETQAPSPDTARILQAIANHRARETSEDRAAAHRLNLKGDEAYRKGDYSAAFTAYSNSYPNAATAYAYLMAGDSDWRGRLAFSEKPRADATGSGACTLTNAYFAHDLSLDLSQHQQVGLALLSRDPREAGVNATLLSRARGETACLQSMAEQSSSLPHTSCVDLNRLRGCLGAPLLH